MSMSSRAGARDARARLAAARGNEAELQAQVCELLNLYGWKWHHETDSRRTTAGWPDLFAVHPVTGWTLVLELKSATGQVTAAQLDWLYALGMEPPGNRAGHAPWTELPELRRVVALVRPSDFDAVAATILARSRGPALQR